jgi:hypothetical protein
MRAISPRSSMPVAADLQRLTCRVGDVMSDALGTYLDDHLAGAAGAIAILEHLRDEHAGTPVGRLAIDLLAEIEADRAIVQGLAERAGNGGSPLKDATAWLGEKVSRLKIGRTAGGELGLFEALEMLALGILGKLALWKALSAVAPFDARLPGIDYDHLIGRAENQHARVEAHRLDAAHRALVARPAAA